MADNFHTFVGFGRSVSIDESVWCLWQEHRQIQSRRLESFGVLIGSTTIDQKDIHVEEVTTPMLGDRQSQNSFDLKDFGHQRAVDAAHSRSDGSLIYLGTWHTHPQAIPSPSLNDRSDWRRCSRRNRERPQIFVIAGTERTRVFVRWGRWFRALRQLTETRGSKNPRPIS